MSEDAHEMSEDTPPVILRVNGWQVIEGADGLFGVYSDDGLEAGPFQTQREAISEARWRPGGKTLD